jgi:hypothetical protein
MTARIGWAALAAAVAAAYGCGSPSTGGNRPPGEARVDASPPAVSRDSVPATPATPVPSDTVPRPGAASPTAAAGAPPLIPLQAILAGGAEPGRRVRVEGVCIGYSRVLALGPQPRTRSDWQLVDDSVAVWVVGPYPPGCSGTVPAEQAGTFTVVVASDTLPALGTAPPRPRLYLIHTPPE